MMGSNRVAGQREMAQVLTRTNKAQLINIIDAVALQINHSEARRIHESFEQGNGIEWRI